MAFATPKGRKKPDHTPRRCVECGEYRSNTPPHPANPCWGHLDVLTIPWNNEYLWSGEYVRIDGVEVLRMFQDRPAEAPKYYPGVTKEKVFEVTELYKKWGLMPVRKVDRVRSTYNPLFEARRPVREATGGKNG